MKTPNTDATQKRGFGAKTLGVCIKYYKTIWFLALIVLFSIFVFGEFKPKIRLSAVSAEDILFCAWIVLLFIPLIKSIDIAGILKLVTKEDEKKAKETEILKTEKDSLVNNINLNISNTNAQQSSESTIAPESSPYPYNDKERDYDVL